VQSEPCGGKHLGVGQFIDASVQIVPADVCEEEEVVEEEEG
jgi:hypothetical protein